MSDRRNSNGHASMCVVTDESSALSKAWCDRHGVRLVEAKSTGEFEHAFEQLVAAHTCVLSLHPSSDLSDSFAHAQRAAARFIGRCDMRVIDTRTAAQGLGMVVRRAAELAAAGASPDATTRAVRIAAQNVYAAFALEDVSAAQDLARAAGVRVKDSGAVPVLALEDGRLVVVEFVRSLDRAVERVAEYAAEFGVPGDVSLVCGEARQSAVASRLGDLLRAKVAGLPPPRIELVGEPLLDWLGPRSVGVILLDANALA